MRGSITLGLTSGVFPLTSFTGSASNRSSPISGSMGVFCLEKGGHRGGMGVRSSWRHRGARRGMHTPFEGWRELRWAVRGLGGWGVKDGGS